MVFAVAWECRYSREHANGVDMERVAVESEAMKWIAYDARRRELDIEYPKNGDVYRYFEVSLSEFHEFLTASSKGTYLNQTFKRKNHPYKVVRHGKH